MQQGCSTASTVCIVHLPTDLVLPTRCATELEKRYTNSEIQYNLWSLDFVDTIERLATGDLHALSSRVEIPRTYDNDHAEIILIFQ